VHVANDLHCADGHQDVGIRLERLAWIWLKYNERTGKCAFGTDYGTRKNCEPCLLARRGQPKVKSRSVRDLIIAPHREHSRKPDEQYARIEALFRPAAVRVRH